MPAVKRELPSREDLALALAAFHPALAALPLPPLPSYLAPLPGAAALPPAASLPAAAAGYEALLAPPLRPPRACLSLHEAAPRLHLPRDPLAVERLSAPSAAVPPDFQPLLDHGEPCIEVECGANRALLYVRRLCQGSKGPSIRHRGEWLTPNEFQFVSGRETAKDWKRSIRHKGKSLKTLMSKGILQVHPPICDCPGCRISSPVNRGRLADKRTATLTPTRVLKKERNPSFSASDGDSDGSGPACGRRPGLKQEDDPHVHIMKRRVHTHWDVNISFRETSCRGCCHPTVTAGKAMQMLAGTAGSVASTTMEDCQDSSLPTLISSVHHSRHLVMPEHQSRCDFQRGSLELGLGPAGDLLGKRLGRSPHIGSDCSSEKKARGSSPPEALLLPELGPSMAPEDHYRRLMSALSEAGACEDPQRFYHLGLPSHDLLRVRQEVAAAALRSPSGLDVHLPSSPAGQRRKQGLAAHREGTAPAAALSFSDRELPQPPPLLSPQNAPHIALGPHLRPPFLGVPSALCQTPGYGFLPPGQADMLARQQELLRKQSLARLEVSAELLRHQELEGAPRPELLASEAALRTPDGADELQRRGALLVLKHSAAPLLALPPQGPPGPGPPSPPREPVRRAPRKGGAGVTAPKSGEPKDASVARLWAQDGSEDERPRDPDAEDSEAASAPGSSAGQAVAGRIDAEGKGLFSGSALPLGFPYFHAGAMGSLCVDGDEATTSEDVSKWTVEDVCSFVEGLSGCSEYARVFREQGIDGETLPLLTEEHLLTTMGLKLGPALKIRAQVARRLGRLLYMASFPVALPLQPPTQQVLEPQLPTSPATTSPPYGIAQPPTGLASPRQDNGSGTLDPAQTLC